MKEISSYEEFCKAFKEGGESRNLASLLLNEQDWMIKTLKNSIEDDIDSSLDDLFFKNEISKVTNNSYKMDMLSYINEQVEDACRHIFINLHKKIIRENVLMPVHKAKEINSYGIAWLSRKPGRTIREKMSGSNSIMAVKRRMSLDTGENRLLIAFTKRLNELLKLRIYNMEEYKSQEEEDFQELISSFLRDEDLLEIKRWENLPPNNTLLSDNYYKKVWKAWNEIKDLDEKIYKSFKSLDDNILMTVYVELLFKLKKYFSIAQVPVNVDYSKHKVEVLSDIFYGVDDYNNKISISKSEDEILIEYSLQNYKVKVSNLKILLYKDNSLKKELPINAGNMDRNIDLIMVNIGCKKNTSKNILPDNTQKYRDIAIDFFSVHPSYISSDNKIKKLDIRILQQKFSKKYISSDEHYISCGYSDAILINEDVHTYTVSSAIDENANEEMKRLVMMLEKSIISDSITFLFPDIFNEFQLSLLHKSARLAYRKVRLFPKSIGMVFDFQDSEDFKKYFKKDDFVLVVDLIDDEITLTLVKGVYNEKIYKNLPEYDGIMWERHPTFSVKCEEYLKRIYNTLIQGGCQEPEKLYKALGKKGILQEKDKLMCLFDERHWFKLESKLVDRVENINTNITDIVDAFILKRKDIIGKSDVHILSLNKSFVYKGLNRYAVVDEKGALYGYSKHENLRKKAAISLWRDHLPDLSIKLLYGKFDLVNQATVLPNFNSIQTIKINNTFTLVKNKLEYRFELVQNDMNSKRQYEAVIKSPSIFPLKEDVECRLNMTYRYGAEDPYQLVFVPLDKKKAGFREARVDWKPKDEYEYNGLAYPDFPKRYTWEELQQFPKLDGSGYTNLTEWVSDAFELLKNGYCTIDPKDYNLRLNKVNEKHMISKNILFNDEIIRVNFKHFNFQEDIVKKSKNQKISFDLQFKMLEEGKRRYTINLFEDSSRNIWNDRGMGYSCIRTILIDGIPQKIAFYESNFENEDDFNPSITHISFEINRRPNGQYLATKIRPGVSIQMDPPIKVYDAKNIRLGNKPADKVASGGILFAMHTIFFGGHSIYEEGCPAELKNNFKKAIPNFIKIYNECENSFLKSKMFTMMSLSAKDIGTEYYDIAVKMVEDYRLENIEKMSDIIGCALGDLTTSDQIRLFNELVKIKLDKVICVFSKAIWKNKDFIFNMKINNLIKTFEYAINYLYRNVEDLISISDFKTQEFISKKIKLSKDISMCIEYIIGVFRVRELNDDGINNAISMNNPKVQVLYRIVEKMIDKNIKIKSRLKLEVEKKTNFGDKEIPDLLYVLLVYITGNTGESDIRISGITEDEDI